MRWIKPALTDVHRRSGSRCGLTCSPPLTDKHSGWVSGFCVRHAVGMSPAGEFLFSIMLVAVPAVDWLCIAGCVDFGVVLLVSGARFLCKTRCCEKRVHASVLRHASGQPFRFGSVVLLHASDESEHGGFLTRSVCHTLLGEPRAWERCCCDASLSYMLPSGAGAWGSDPVVLHAAEWPEHGKFW